MNGVKIVGAGLAGCEAALYLSDRGIPVELFEQKPVHFSDAHHSDRFAELVCSNSLKAERPDSSSGLLKEEMKLLGSHILSAAYSSRVDAGGALAVDRNLFSVEVTRMVSERPNIQVHREVVESIPEGITVIATGPLTDGKLAEAIREKTGETQLSFFDAAAPVVTSESLDLSKIFSASRYGRGGDDYLNCPFDKAGYEQFVDALLHAARAPLHTADRMCVYEGCMPVEIMAERGRDTLRFGPLRPVGLIDPHTGHRPWANVQLRREDSGGRCYNLVGFQTNLRFPEQKRVFGLIPGLEHAEYVRFGVMHRNSFLNSPALLAPDLSLASDRDLYFAGQMTGVEGYMESAACGLIAAHQIARRMQGTTPLALPKETMCGALMAYLQTPNRDFQPMGSNMGLLPPLSWKVRDKQERYRLLSERALKAMKACLNEEK